MIKFLIGRGLFGLLLILASLPINSAAALALRQADRAGTPIRSGQIDARLRRLNDALRTAEPGADHAITAVDAETLSWFRDGFRNGGFRDGGFRDGGFRNGGFRNGGFRNGAWLNF